MTGRSYNSIASERRQRRNKVTDEDLFNYVLRVAYLSFLLTPRAPQAAPLASTVNGDARDSRAYESRLSGITNSFAAFGDLIKDMGGRDGPRPVKFPEKLLKVLDQRMQDIAMGKDQVYHDQITRRTIARFWTTFKDPNFYRQIERNRKIEELILNFVTTASTSLRQDPQLAANDGWKLELNNQIAHFTRIVRDSLKNVSHVPPELHQRVDMYVSKLVPSSTTTTTTTTIQPPPESGPSSRSEPTTSTATLADMVLVRIVGRLFEKTDDELQREITNIKRFCTEKAALIDLKTCLQNITAGLPFPGRREDFPDDASFQHWKSLEQTHLSQLMVIMVQFNPELAKSTPADGPVGHASPRPESLYSNRGSISSRNSVALLGDVSEQGDDESAVQSFTYIPPNPKKFYKKLIERCIEYDLRAMHTLPEDQEVPLGILSTSHLDIINECSLRWRITQSYRVSAFLEVIKYKYEREEVPLECIPEALQHVEKEFEPERWPNSDREYLGTVYSSLFNIFLAALYHNFESLPNLRRKAIAPFLGILERVKASGLLELYNVDIEARMRELSDRIRILAMHHYTDKSSGILANPGINRALPFILLSEGLEEVAAKLDQTFKQPLLGQLDIVGLFVETQVPLFLTDLEESKRRLLESSSNTPPDTPIEDIFTLYRVTKSLFNLMTLYAPEAQPQFDLGAFFEPYVRQWLLTTDSKTAQWVQAAVSVDDFDPKGEERNSSSVVDLFFSLDTPINFLMNLEWPDEYQEARFFTSLAKTVSKLMEQYCHSIEETFMEEMFPRPEQPYLQPQKQSAWLEKAKLSIQGDKKIEPFNFKPESCVKLNNIAAARGLLDKIYIRMRADEMSRILGSHPPVPSKGPPRNLFTVKIVMAEGLGGAEKSHMDTFATLSDEHGNRLAKTRTIYETTDPRWEETFDISVEAALWLMISIRDRSLVGKHDIVSRSYICLDPRRYGDFLAHDLWLDLDPVGRILVRISMEGEQDDILFFFGRAFRSLKRTEGDMVRIFIDKMSILFRDILSRTTIKKLSKTPGALDYSKAIGNVTSLFGSLTTASSSEVQIPLPSSEKPRIKADVGATDEELEAAIGPMCDYLNDNLQVLNSTLNDSARETVMSKIWKEILIIIEGILVPSLGDTPSSMKPLYDRELDIVFKWLRFLLNFFYAEGEGMSMEELQNAKYREIMSLRLYYDWHTDQLMEEAVRMMQSQLRAAPTIKKRAKTVYSQRSLGTIKKRKTEKRHDKQADNSAEPILKVLRMRPNTSDFLTQQLKIMSQIQAEQQSRKEQRVHSFRPSVAQDVIPPVLSK